MCVISESCWHGDAHRRGILSHDVLEQLAGIVILGVIAQWIAWRLRLPSILLLLAAGIVVGPMTRMIQADILFGDLLLPFVSLSIAVVFVRRGVESTVPGTAPA